VSCDTNLVSLISTPIWCHLYRHQCGVINIDTNVVFSITTLPTQHQQKQETPRSFKLHIFGDSCALGLSEKMNASGFVNEAGTAKRGTSFKWLLTKEFSRDVVNIIWSGNNDPNDIYKSLRTLKEKLEGNRVLIIISTYLLKRLVDPFTNVFGEDNVLEVRCERLHPSKEELEIIIKQIVSKLKLNSI
jgi:hypothetical protein